MSLFKTSKVQIELWNLDLVEIKIILRITVDILLYAQVLSQRALLWRTLYQCKIYQQMHSVRVKWSSQKHGETALVLLIPNCTRHRMITYTNHCSCETDKLIF